MSKEIKRICFDCANFANGRLTGNFNSPFLDKKYQVKSYRASPSHKRKCNECGNKVQSYVEIVASRKIKGEENACEKCGGELKVKLIGDESYDKCVNCGRIKN